MAGTAGAAGSWTAACGTPSSCFAVDPQTNERVQLDAYATYDVIDGQLVLVDVWCPTLATPAPSPDALREQALRLLPAVAVGSAWSKRALVNAEAVLWADTTSARTLRTVTVVGQRVALRIRFDHADWDYGDGHTATLTVPGKAYDATGDPCAGAQCPDYRGHTYTKTGSVTMTLRVSWTAQYSLNGGRTWTALPEPITGPPATHTLQVLQARSVLVPDP